MSSIAASDIFEVIYDFTYNGQHDLLTTHWYVANITGSPPTLSAFIPAFRGVLDGFGGLSDKVAACYVDDAQNGKLSIQKIYPARFIRSTSASNAPIGTNDGYTAKLPQNVSMAITVRSDNSGPHFLGTKHIGCLGDNFVEDGLVTTAGKTALAGLGDQLVAVQDVVVSGVNVAMVLIILNRVSPSVSAVVTNYIRGDTSRVQRRRTVGLGI